MYVYICNLTKRAMRRTDRPKLCKSFAFKNTYMKTTKITISLNSYETICKKILTCNYNSIEIVLELWIRDRDAKVIYSYSCWIYIYL